MIWDEIVVEFSSAAHLMHVNFLGNDSKKKRWEKKKKLFLSLSLSVHLDLCSVCDDNNIPILWMHSTNISLSRDEKKKIRESTEQWNRICKRRKAHTVKILKRTEKES